MKIVSHQEPTSSKDYFPSLFFGSNDVYTKNRYCSYRWLLARNKNRRFVDTKFFHSIYW